MRKYLSYLLALLISFLLIITAGNALAKGPSPMDVRHRHDVGFPRIGAHFKVLPPHHSTVHFNRAKYHYYGGVWYSRAGVDFVVVAPPVGIIAPVLPPHYTTIWYRGIPYYYGNNTYYVWKAEKNGYMVVEPPGEVASEKSTTTVLTSELYVYPKRGQSEQQQSEDRFACHQWAVKETGYDPSQPPQNLRGAALGAKREDYQRAIKACLDAKGYSVR